MLHDRHVVAVDKTWQDILHIVRVHVVEEGADVAEAQRRLALCGSCLDDGTQECFDFIHA
eukprot:8986254-Lingulodinium_polyedra.AAC.1